MKKYLFSAEPETLGVIQTKISLDLSSISKYFRQAGSLTENVQTFMVGQYFGEGILYSFPQLLISRKITVHHVMLDCVV